MPGERDARAFIAALLSSPLLGPDDDVPVPRAILAAALPPVAPDLAVETLARCLGNFEPSEWESLPITAQAAWRENAVDVNRALAMYRRLRADKGGGTA